MSKKSLIPLFDRVLVKKIAPATKVGGILLPDSVQKKSNRGIVISTGIGTRDKDGKVTPLHIKEGDDVLLAEFGGLEVDLDGEEFVSWSQGITQSDVCLDRVTLIKESKVLWPEEGGEGSVLEPGNYTFKFSCPIPESAGLNYEETGVGATPFLENLVLPENTILPITFGNEKSYIRYLAKAFVEINTKIEEEQNTVRFERVVPFKVVESFDQEILIQPPKIAQLEKSFLFGGSPIKAEFTVANGGVIFSGQRLFLHATVKNESSRSVNGLFLRIEQIISFKSHNQKKEEQTVDRRTILINALVENSGLPPGATFDKDLILEIPPFISGTILHGQYISRRYELNLDVELSISGSMTLTHPITLLEWSPQLKGLVPDVVPVTMKNQNEENKEDINLDS